ncbi:glycosyltransferase family 4 protein [soil metagenome]
MVGKLVTMKNVLILCLYPKDKVPGQRFRFEQYLNYLTENGFNITLSNLLTEKEYAFFYKKGNYVKKAALALKSVLKRYSQLRSASEYDIIFIFREVYFLGNSYFERKFSKKSNVIFDYDDAIWITDTVSENNKLFKFLKNPDKIRKIISLSKMVFAGNQFLADYAKKYNNNVIVVPTTIDTSEYLPDYNTRNDNKVCIGWSGSFSTIVHFVTCTEALRLIKEKYGNKVYFKVIGSAQYHNPELDIKGLPWRRETEVKDLQEMDIGIMPLPDDEWSRGKCGLKGLQYMALGIPTIMSPVGVNKKIIQDGENGFLASDTFEWVEKLSILIDSKELRKKIGCEGRKTVQAKFSVEANKNLYLKYFNKVIERSAI